MPTAGTLFLYTPPCDYAAFLMAGARFRPLPSGKDPVCSGMEKPVPLLTIWLWIACPSRFWSRTRPY